MLDLTLLDHWQGGNAILWIYSRSYQGMIIRIERAGHFGNLHITFIDTTHICCPTRWENCFFELAELSDGYMLRDIAAGVEIHAGMIELAEDCEPVYRRPRKVE